MKNYYEILEVDKNASDEIIKVAYKSLVKENHPDLKEGRQKTLAEQKIKQINEAYDILSNEQKRFEYDQTLMNENISQEQYNFILNENNKLKQELNYLKNYYNGNNSNYHNYYNTNNPYSNYNNQQSNDYYNDTNINYTNNKKNIRNIFSHLDDSLKSVIAFVLTLLILFILFSIPFIRDFIINILGSGYVLIIIITIVAYVYFFRNRKQ